MKPTTDINIRGTVRLIAPCVLKAEMPISEAATQTVLAGRDTVCNILAGEDPRLMAVVGPCSIHDEDAAMEYARRLKVLAARVADRTAFFTALADESTGDRTGVLVEFDKTTKIFEDPADKRTEDYISGRFG